MLNAIHELRDSFADQLDVNPFDCGIRVIMREDGEPKKVIFTLPNGQSYMMSKTFSDITTDGIINNWSGEPIC